MRSIKVVTEGSPSRTKIFDVDTGERIGLVQTLDFKFSVTLSESHIVGMLTSLNNLCEEVKIVEFVFKPGAVEALYQE